MSYVIDKNIDRPFCCVVSMFFESCAERTFRLVSHDVHKQYECSSIYSVR